MAGRPRKPTHLHRLQGTFRRDRHNDRGDLRMKSNGDPVMPDWLDPKGREAWQEIVDAAPYGVLWRSDSIFVALMADVLVQIRAGEAGSEMQNLFMRGLGKLGMTPASRSKLNIAVKPVAPNRFADI